MATLLPSQPASTPASPCRLPQAANLQDDYAVALALQDREVAGQLRTASTAAVRPGSVSQKQHSLKRRSPLQLLTKLKWNKRGAWGFHPSLEARLPSPDCPGLTGGPPGDYLLSQRLAQYGMYERVVAADGNCQFCALADQLYGSCERHLQVRHYAAQQLRARPDLYSNFVDGSYTGFCKQVERPGSWGDHITLQALSDYFGIRITVVTSTVVPAYRIQPVRLKSQRILYLSFQSEVHYNSIGAVGR